MLRLSRVEFLLRLLTVLYVAIAAVALFAPTRVPDDLTPPAALSAPPNVVTGDRANGMTDVGDVVAANIFSLSRQAPARRYDPLTFDAEPTAPAAAPVVTEPVASDEEAVPKLFGIVGGPNGAAALLRLDASTSGALLYRVGERGGAYRVEEINEQSVVLSGPAGRIVLRLVRQEG